MDSKQRIKATFLPPQNFSKFRSDALWLLQSTSVVIKPKRRSLDVQHECERNSVIAHLRPLSYYMKNSSLTYKPISNFYAMETLAVNELTFSILLYQLIK